MDRRTIIFCLAVLAFMILGVGAAVAFLYSGSNQESERGNGRHVKEGSFLLLSAVPSDAMAVACFSEVSKAPQAVLNDLGIEAGLCESPLAVSLHYSGTLVPLFLIDTGESAALPSDEVSSLMEDIRLKGYTVEYLDCSTIAERSAEISKHSLLLVSRSEQLVRSSVRHIGRSISILSAQGFDNAMASVSSDDILFISNPYIDKILSEILSKKYSSRSDIISRMSEWMVFELESGASGLKFCGTAISDSDASEFINVLKSSESSSSSVAEVLPSYTLFAASLPIGNLETYVNAYERYIDSRQALQRNNSLRKELKKKMGLDPYQFMQQIEIEEVAVAAFTSGEDLENVMLLKTGTDELGVIFKGTDVTQLKDYVPEVHAWPYGSFVSSVFGKLFDLKDESCFTWNDGWIIIGSMDAVSDYVKGKTLEYTLQEYLNDAGCEGLLSDTKSSFVSYFSFTTDCDILPSIFKKSFLDKWGYEFSGADYIPAVVHVGTAKNGTFIDASISRHELQKIKAPVFERDTVVNVPMGPFEVRNSGTGKINRFYQNSHLSLCLSEEGKDLWGVPFKEPICGTAHNIDYFANGKLQIIFGAGSRIYIIDRLGRYVRGFPLDLKKKIVLGPDLYDFNGSKRYNIMVLHDDNTVEMYNLKGEKPASWKGIRPSEKVKSLPERIKVGGSSFWVVRTSIQTLIYPFYGGEPLTIFTGDKMIRPDSKVRNLDTVSVEVDCYDGIARTVKLK